MTCCRCHIRSLIFDASACVAGTATGYSPQRRNPTTVASETNKTIAAANAANCGNESSQVCPINRPRNEVRGSGFTADFTGISASMTLRMRSHIAFSFGGASYWSRCVWQKPTIAVKSLRTLSQSKHSFKCVFRVDSSRWLIVPSIRSWMSS